MARPLRIEYPGAWYHIMNRGRRGERVFQDARDRQAFVELLEKISEMFKVGVTAYCLMPNHFHLLIQTPEGNLTRCMRHLGGVYTQLYNRRHGQDGQLFRGRYKAILIEENEYLLGLVHYIHHNPLKAGLAARLKDYPWTSHHGYLSSSDTWAWLNVRPVLSRFSDDPVKARQGYRQYMARGGDEELEGIFSRKKLPAVLGNQEFVQKIKDCFFPSKSAPEVPDSRFLAPSAPEVTAAVCEAYGIREEELHWTRRGFTNEPRNVAVYLLRTLCGKTLPEIGALFSIRNYSTVSSILARVNKQLAVDDDFKSRLESLKDRFLKSQRQI